VKLYFHSPRRLLVVCRGRLCCVGRSRKTLLHGDRH